MKTRVSQALKKFNMRKVAHCLLSHFEGHAVCRCRLRKATGDLMFVPYMVANMGQSCRSPGISWKLDPHRFSPCDCLLERLIGVLRSAGGFQHQGIVPVMFNLEPPRVGHIRRLSDYFVEMWKRRAINLFGLREPAKRPQEQEEVVVGLRQI